MWCGGRKQAINPTQWCAAEHLAPYTSTAVLKKSDKTERHMILMSSSSPVWWPSKEESLRMVWARAMLIATTTMEPRKLKNEAVVANVLYDGGREAVKKRKGQSLGGKHSLLQTVAGALRAGAGGALETRGVLLTNSEHCGMAL